MKIINIKKIKKHKKSNFKSTSKNKLNPSKEQSKKLYLYKIFYLAIFVFLLFILNETSKSKQMKGKYKVSSKYEDFRVLVYGCSDELYSHYLPIFINTILQADKLKLIDIEICTNLDKFSEDEEKAIDYLRKNYHYSKIKINYNAFIKNQTGIFYDNIKLKDINSVRFVSQPKIKNKYVYFSDTDIFVFVDNFYLELIDDMNRRKIPYSNIVRPNNKCLSGLHFIEYDSYYPITFQKNFNLYYDEELLYNIIKEKGIKIDYNIKYRPVFGIHASPNRPNVFAPDFPDWGAANYKFNWMNYCKTSDFKFIYPLLNSYIKEKILMLNNYYGIDEIAFEQILKS